MEFVLGVITARGGSKGIPKKNITDVGGKPLIAYTISAAKESRRLNDCIVSTDSREIADCATEYGMKTEELRPPELATDTAKNEEAVIYEVKKYEQANEVTVDIIVLLQPTTPLRKAEDIDKALDIFLESDSDSLISVYDANFVHPNIMYFMEDGKLTPVLESGKVLKRRQEFKTAYVRNGAIYISARAQVMERKKFVGKNPAAYVMPYQRSINIDEPFDLEMAEWLMSKHG
ncbi:MAG: acylneuraminate cytidylyltransferase family protein [Balneolaceae bacterium]|nr:acylneuraminate cytidylyltransferase family protein [Balneolaceae bacterium]